MLMDLFIETLTGVSFELRVSPAETVMSIKSKIQRAEGIPITQQHLIWQNDELDDHRRLRDYSISAGSTIRLVLGLRGGPLNAHRIPPLRLTPIQLTPTAPTSFLSRVHRISSASTRLSQLSRLQLPTTCSGFPTQSTSVLQKNDSTLSTSTGSVNDLQQPKQHTSAEANTLIGRNTLVTTSDVPPPTGETTDAFVAGSAPSLESLGSSCPNKMDTERTQSNENEPSKLPLPTAESSQHCNPAPVSHPEDVPVTLPDSQPEMKDTFVLNPSSTERVNLPCATNSTDDTKLQSTPTELSTPVEYPPLFPLSGSARPPFSSYDLSPYWRLYESSRITTLPKSFITRNAFSVASAPEPGSDSTSSDSPDELDSQNFTVPAKPGTNYTALDGEDSTFPETGTTPTTAASAAATLLAGILSNSGDQLSLPKRTSGSERTTVYHPRYPYHWLRRATPLSEETEIPHQMITSGTFWDPDEVGDDCDPLGNTLFDAEPERDDEDGDEDDDGDDDDESVEARGAYGCELDDDDSLADLEDYLFYYRTGDLLFGPPSLTSICPPYYYAIRDSFGTELEADFGMYTTRTVKDNHTVGQHNDTTWHEECNQLAEKVNDLKNRMSELRIRRQRRQKTRTRDSQACDQIASEPKSENEANKTENSNSKGTGGQPGSKADKPECPSDVRPLPTSIQPSLSPSQSLNVQPSPETSETKPLQPSQDPNQRRRRFATVTPPKLLSLLRSSQLDFTTEPSNSGVQSSSTDRIPSTALSDNQFKQSVPPPLAPLSFRDSSHRPLSSFRRPQSSSTSCQPSNTSRLVGKSPSSLFATPDTKPPTNFRSSLLNHPSMALTFSNSSGKLGRPRTSAVPVSSSSRILPEVTERPRPPVSSGGKPVTSSTTSEKTVLPMIPTTPGKSESSAVPKSPQRPTYSPSNSMRRKRCALCLRRTGLVNSYSCRCGRNFCSRHRYAEVHTCPFDYKAEGRQALIDANPVVTASKLPKI